MLVILINGFDFMFRATLAAASDLGPMNRLHGCDVLQEDGVECDLTISGVLKWCYLQVQVGAHVKKLGYNVLQGLKTCGVASSRVPR